jgi:hypothetical protein
MLQTMAQLLSSLLPEEAILVRTLHNADISIYTARQILSVQPDKDQMMMTRSNTTHIDRQVHVTSTENQEGSHMGDSKIDRRIENKTY